MKEELPYPDVAGTNKPAGKGVGLTHARYFARTATCLILIRTTLGILIF